MKKAKQVVLFIMLLCCDFIFAQVDCTNTEFSEDDFIAAKQEINFTAYMKDDDSNVYFIVNEYTRATYSEENKAGITGYEAPYVSPNPGNL